VGRDIKKTRRDHLVDTLKNLTKIELKEFNSKLTDIELKEDYTHIPRGELERAECVEIATLLISHYGKAYGVEVAISVLKMSMQSLQTAPDWTLFFPSGLISTAKSIPWTRPPYEMHFVDRHREQLIQRVTLVEGVMDKLLGDVLDNEEYQTIKAERTNPMKMRKLYEFTLSWNKYCKDQLYEALKDKCKFLVKDLEEE
uniref:CARD domain-containing protein n=1 Tax=Pelusios castaneus TaxID=367368 RepID=A0A8C8SRT2_9SAUR